MNEIDLRKVDLNLLVVFDVLMAERSVTRAAARLSRTQSAVSHSLSRLREQVGDPLLVKDGGRMRPSPRAERLAAELGPVLAGMRRLLAPPQAFVPATSRRVFRIDIPDLTMAVFGVLMAQIRVAAPGVTVEWVARDRHTPLALAEERVDMALLPAALAMPDGVAGELVGRFRWATFAREGHPAIADWGKKAWSRWPHVAVRLGEHIPSPVGAAAGAAARRVGVWVPHFSAVAPLLASTDLLATLPMIVMADSLKRHRLRALSPPFPIPPMPHRLAWSARLAGDPAIVWLRDHMRTVFRDAIAAADELPIGPPLRARRRA